MRCPQMWYWGYVEALTPRVEKKAAADFGTLFHVSLAEYYLPGTQRGPHPADTWERLAKEQITTIKTFELQDDELVATWEDFYELGLALAEAYIERYQGDPHWCVLDAERRFAVTIPDIRIPPQLRDGHKGYTPICTLVGTFDLCIRDLNDGLVKMVDHKTVNRLYTGHLELDPQPSTYIAVATKVLRDQELIGPKESVKGMEYNFIKRAKLDERIRDANGVVRNKPLKKHYIDAITKWEAERVVGDPYTEKTLSKWTIPELAEAAEKRDLTVIGDPSKDQSSGNFVRVFVPRSPKARQRTIIRISQEASVMEMIAAGKLPVIKNTTKDCAFCKFYDLCELDENGEDTTYFKETVFKKQDPYADHRPDAVNSKVL